MNTVKKPDVDVFETKPVKYTLFTPLSWWDKFRSLVVMQLLRYWLGRNKQEIPQTFSWNVTKVNHKENWWLHETGVAIVSGDPKACRKKRRYFRLIYWRRRFWRKNYVVIKPSDSVPAEAVWFLGWMTEDGVEISRIPLVGPVRKLRGPKRTAYFGINVDQKQIKVLKYGFGSVDETGNFSKLVLL